MLLATNRLAKPTCGFVSPSSRVYSEARHLLRLWPGYPRKQVTGLQATINELRGTPQKTVDWTDPSAWIPERLQREDRELARAIWDGSKGAVNPRHTYGHWLLAQRYDLLREDDDGVLQLTKTGQAFLEQPGGEVESAIDEAEGLTKLLSIVADSGPARAGGLVTEWADYQNVDVTARSGDGGVDVVGDIELGITSVREVVQVKRHRRPVQRKDLDALRGSLYRFNAIRGTIVTTSRFAKGTQQAAFVTGTAPITLIDGDKLIDLLIKHGIGVRRLPIKLLEVDAEALAAVQKAD